MNSSAKPKLNSNSQVTHLEQNGVKFTISTKEDAINFLKHSSYFYKLKSYSKNYETKATGEYNNLEFAYLQELSTLDMYFRRLNIRLTLDIEHMIKTKIMRDFNNNENCDGYEIVSDFLNVNHKLKDSLRRYKANGYTAKDNVLKKYNLNLAIWNFIEIIEFGNFIEFCNYYYMKYSNEEYTKIKSMLWSVKCLRNSSAHNNCLLHNLNPALYPMFRPNGEVTSYLKEHLKIKKDAIYKKMTIPTLHDFIISLMVYNQIICSENMKKAFYKDLYKLINLRFKRKKEYFKRNTLLLSNYNFLRKFIIHLKKS